MLRQADIVDDPVEGMTARLDDSQRVFVAGDHLVEAVDDIADDPGQPGGQHPRVEVGPRDAQVAGDLVSACLPPAK